MVSDKEMNNKFLNWQFFEIKDLYIRIQEPLYRDITEGGGANFMCPSICWVACPIHNGTLKSFALSIDY